MNSNELPLVAVVGPTAVGKTAVGIALAQQLGGEIISADAVAVYRGLDIGAAKPDAVERAQAAFHLIDVADPDQDFTVADFEHLATEAIAKVRARGHLPIIVGGTGLYVRALTATLSVPNVPPQPEFRAARWVEAGANEAGYLHRQLSQVDPVAAAKMAPEDNKRIIRALEVWYVSGQPMSSFHTPEGVQGVAKPDTFLFGLNRTRPDLYARIDERVDTMLQAGFINEVRDLLSAGYDARFKAMQSLGYRHLLPVVQGERSLADVTEELKRDTRRYAKRQLSWFNADTRINWISVDDKSPEECAATLTEMLARLRKTNKTHSVTLGKDSSDEQAAGQPARHVPESGA